MAVDPHAATQLYRLGGRCRRLAATQRNRTDSALKRWSITHPYQAQPELACGWYQPGTNDFPRRAIQAPVPLGYCGNILTFYFGSQAQYVPPLPIRAVTSRCEVRPESI